MEIIRSRNTATTIAFPLVTSANNYFTGTAWSATTNSSKLLYTWSENGTPTSASLTNTPTELNGTGIWYLGLTQAETSSTNPYILVKLKATEILEQSLLIHLTNYNFNNNEAYVMNQVSVSAQTNHPQVTVSAINAGLTVSTVTNVTNPMGVSAYTNFPQVRVSGINGGLFIGTSAYTNFPQVSVSAQTNHPQVTVSATTISVSADVRAWRGVTPNGLQNGRLDVDVYAWNGAAPNGLQSGRVDSYVGVNNDKTGYSITANSDKTGYSLGNSVTVSAYNNFPQVYVSAGNITNVTGNVSGSVNNLVVSPTVTVGQVTVSAYNNFPQVYVSANGDKTGYSITANSDKINYSLSTTQQTNLVSAVWDEVLQGTTHNVNRSAGKRLRDLGTSVIVEELLPDQSSAALNEVILDGGASSVDGTYDPAIIVITEGTGVGQSRMIYEYVGSTKKATLDRDWKIKPDTTSYYQIIGNPGREHVNEGAVRGSTNNTVTLNANASSYDNCYVNELVFIKGGTGQDQVGLISSYNGTTKVATITENWNQNPGVGASYVIIPTHLHEQTEIGKVSVSAVDSGLFIGTSAYQNFPQVYVSGGSIGTTINTPVIVSAYQNFPQVSVSALDSSVNTSITNNILNSVIDVKTLKEVLEVLLAMADGKIVRVGDTFEYFKQDNATSLFTNSHSTSARDRI